MLKADESPWSGYKPGRGYVILSIQSLERGPLSHVSSTNQQNKKPIAAGHLASTSLIQFCGAMGLNPFPSFSFLISLLPTSALISAQI
jgi:hypothetical protein